MAFEIRTPKGEAELTEFVAFHDRVYASRGAFWPVLVPLQLGTLMGDSPFAEGKSYQPFEARRDGQIVARCAALVDQHYLDRWQEPLGHVVYFEAMPDAHEEAVAVLREACGWLRDQDMRAARTGFGGMEFPYVTDDYESLPPSLVRFNPPYYHRFIKDAGFESEQGWVDYKIEVTPALVERWEGSLRAAEARGFRIVPLRDVPEDQRVDLYLDVWNDAFRRHWGATAFTREQVDLMMSFFGPMGMFDLSVFAYDGDDVIGVLSVTPSMAEMAVANRPLRDDERLNTLGIGVRERARGKGVNLAMASYSFLELAQRGSTHVSYTLVLDDNWPSRRTAEKLGATVCANYLVYRRNFGV